MQRLLCLVLVVILTGCAGQMFVQVPVEDRIENAVSLVPQMDSRKFRSALREYFGYENNKAFAVNLQTGRWGRSWKYRTISEAKDRALSHCDGGGVILLSNNSLQEKNFTSTMTTQSTKQNSHVVTKNTTANAIDTSFPTDPILSIETGMHTAMINRMGIDPNGNFLITPSDDRTVRLWNLKNGELLKVFRVPLGNTAEGGMVQSAAVSPDGVTIAIGVMQSSWESSCSLILFDAVSGKRIKTVRGLPNVPVSMDFSNDGKMLAIAMYGANGIMVFDTKDYSNIFTDSSYGESAMGIDFSNSGKLVSASRDGFVRLYDESFKLSSKKAVSYGADKVPYQVKFSNNGEQIAVGIQNHISVSILSTKDLSTETSLKVEPNGDPHHTSSIWAVTWSNDGKYLYAGGRLAEKDDDGNLKMYLYRWDTNALAKKPAKFKVSEETIVSLQPYSSSGVVYGTTAPSWGVLDGDGKNIVDVSSPAIDQRGNRSRLLLSADALSVRYFDGFGKGAERYFTLKSSPNDESDETLHPPKMVSPGISITRWQHEYKPALNGRTLKGLGPSEESRCYAIAPNGEYFLLGTALKIYAFDKYGELMWTKWGNGEVWGINIAEGKNQFVASYSDGSIRWHDLTDGKELLALFSHKDNKRWVAWTPEGFFDHSPGGEELIAYHLNRDKEQFADFVNV